MGTFLIAVSAALIRPVSSGIVERLMLATSSFEHASKSAFGRPCNLLFLKLGYQAVVTRINPCPGKAFGDGVYPGSWPPNSRCMGGWTVVIS